MAGERLAARFERLGEISGQIRLPGLAVEKIRSGGGFVHKVRGACVERSSLAVRAQCGGPLGRCRSEAEDGVGVARGIRVVREACRIRPARRRLRESYKGRAVEAQPTPRLQRLFDRQASELVPE